MKPKKTGILDIKPKCYILISLLRLERIELSRENAMFVMTHYVGGRELREKWELMEHEG